MRNVNIICLLIAAAIFGLSASRAEDWHDPSPHQIRFVSVQPGVKIETLDWGGTGRPLILIAGAGGTAHAFDDFALLLTPHFHVYGVTRRGYGDSSRPRSGYDADRLGDDVVAVVRKLNIQKPILMGHSFEGQEVSDIATRYPSLIAGAIYLDAIHSYDAASEKEALYWNIEWRQQIEALQKHLTELLESPFDSRPVATALRDRDLPAVQTIAENLLRVEKGRPPWVDPQPADLQSFLALREWYHRIMRLYLPEAEFRQMQATLPDGRPSSGSRSPDWVGSAIMAGRKSFHHINVLKGANHMVFASNPQDVIRESLSFADSLPP